MKRPQKGLVAYVVIIIFAIIIIGGSFYLYSTNKNNEESTESKNAKLLQSAVQKVETETARLEELKRKYSAESAVITQIQKEYFNLKNTILRRTDIMFDNPDSDNPQIRIKINDKDAIDDINSRRLEITRRLKAFEKKMEIITSAPTPQSLLPTLSDLMKSAQSDVNYIQRYVRELENIVSELTPSNSNLTQSQINSYNNIIEVNSLEAEDAISTIATIAIAAIEVYQPTATTTATSTPITQVNPPPVVSPPPTPEPVVTPIQIETQEEIVEEAEAEQILIEEQISGATTTPYYIPQVIMDYQSQMINPYFPSSNTDNLTWPDVAPNTGSERPLLLEGSNQ